jgi:hypothetical protein
MAVHPFAQPAGRQSFVAFPLLFPACHTCLIRFGGLIIRNGIGTGAVHRHVVEG